MQYYINRLKEKGLKITPKREAILDILRKSRRALSPEKVFEKIEKSFVRASYPSVYRNLEEMHTLGILHKVYKPDRRLYYTICRETSEKHHHHIVCERCGKVEAFYDCSLFRKGSIKGYKVLRHILQVEGICPECLGKARQK